MYQCDFCNYESMYKFNVMRHEKGKHGQKHNQQINKNSNQINSHTKAKHEPIQTDIGVRDQPITQTSTQTQNVPVHPDTNEIIRKWQEAYQNLETRNKELFNRWQNQNKQWQAAYNQMQAWRHEDGVYANEEIQQLSRYPIQEDESNTL